MNDDSMKLIDIQTNILMTLALACSMLLSACGGSSVSSENMSSSPIVTDMGNVTNNGAVILKAPKLSFSDTGVSVSDGITRNGLWAVESDLSWEYSLNQGMTWTLGTGSSFEVKGDGPKMIWVRARDNAGNTSEVVVVTCVLDTIPPPPITVASGFEGLTRSLQLADLESGAKWEYALDSKLNWLAGSGSGLGTLGNGLNTIWLRQIDIAGNASAPRAFDLSSTDPGLSHEASTFPLQPSPLAKGFQTMLIHGVVVRGDADYVNWVIPKNHRLKSLKLVRYISDDAIAFFAIQAGDVFDAGVDVNRMLVYGHMGPADINRNVVTNVPLEKLGEGPMTIWFQQTGLLPTEYAIEISIQAVN